jgi:hypothetical protein
MVELTYLFLRRCSLGCVSFVPGIYVSGFLHCDLFIRCQISCSVHFAFISPIAHNRTI